MTKCRRLMLIAIFPMTVHSAAQAARGVSEEVAGWEVNYTTWTCGTSVAAARLLSRGMAVHVPCAGGQPL
ncbi:MAG: hypothetical protein ABIO43_02930 [Sphingomicrobium sp.]